MTKNEGESDCITKPQERLKSKKISPSAKSAFMKTSFILGALKKMRSSDFQF